MIFMFQHLLWALQIKALPPITRLAAIYLASNGTLINDDINSPSDVPTRHVKLSAVQEWIGCDSAELIDAVRENLVTLGFTAIQFDGDELRYSLPELPEETLPAPRGISESRLSIYVITGDRGNTKIGISGLVSKRVLDLQSANPVDKLTVAFEASGPATVIRRVEKKAHAALARYAIGNEWFRVPASQAIEAVQVMLEMAGLKK